MTDKIDVFACKLSPTVAKLSVHGGDLQELITAQLACAHHVLFYQSTTFSFSYSSETPHISDSLRYWSKIASGITNCV